jgi:hypothetical protein
MTNRALFQAIRETNPRIDRGVGRGYRQRTLKTMSRCRIFKMRRERNHIRHIVKATEFRVVAA